MSSPTISRAVVNHSGQMIALILSSPPTAVPSLPITVSVAFACCGRAKACSTPNPTMLTIDPGRMGRVAGVSCLWLSLPYPVLDSDAVSITVPDGCLTTTAGAISGGTVAVENLTGKDLDAIDLSKVTMADGWNAPGTRYFNVATIYANLAKHLTGWAYGDPKLDASGNLLSVTSGASVTFYRSDSTNGLGTGTEGWPSLPEGDYTIEYDDVSPKCSLKQTGASRVSSVLTMARQAGEYFVRPWITAWGAVANLAVWPPGEDRTSKFSRQFLDKIGKDSCIRTLDIWDVNSNGLRSSADVHVRSDLSYARAKTPPLTGNVISIDTYVNATLFPNVTNGSVPLLCRVDKPHGLATGQLVTLGGFTGGVTMSNGAVASLNLYGSACVVLDAVSFVLNIYTGQNAAFTPMTTVGTFISPFSPTIPLADLVDLCNQTNSDLWWNVPPLYDDASILSDVTYFAANLNPGLRVHIEYGNEHWNDGPSFGTAAYCRIQAGLTGLTNSMAGRTNWYCKRSGAVHALVAPVLEDRLIRTFCSQYAGTNVTQTIVDYCSANAIPIDELGVAPYWSGLPNTPDIQPFVSTLTNEQLMDLTETCVSLGVYTNLIPQHKSILAAKYPAAKLVCYEGGPEDGSFGVAGLAGVRLSRMWSLHPRMAQCFLAFLWRLQSGGVSLYVDYTLHAGQNPRFVWGRYLGGAQKRGPGDGSQGGYINATNYFDLDKVEAVIAYAKARWHDAWAANRTKAP